MAYDPKTRLLLNFGEADGSTTTTDGSIYDRVVYLEPITTISASEGPTGGGALNCTMDCCVNGYPRLWIKSGKTYYFEGFDSALAFDVHFKCTTRIVDYQVCIFTVYSYPANRSYYVNVNTENNSLHFYIYDFITSKFLFKYQHNLGYSISDEWHHLRLSINNTSVRAGFDGDEISFSNTGSDVLPRAGVLLDRAYVGDYGIHPSSYEFIGYIAEFRIIQDIDFWSTGGSYTIPHGPYDQAQKISAQLSSELSVLYEFGEICSSIDSLLVSPSSYAFSQGSFGVGLPVNVSLSGISVTYFAGKVGKRHDPKKGPITFLGSHSAKRLVGDTFIRKAEKEFPALWAETFWMKPEAGDLTILSGVFLSYDTGNITAETAQPVAILVSGASYSLFHGEILAGSSYEKSLSSTVREFYIGNITASSALKRVLQGEVVPIVHGSFGKETSKELSQQESYELEVGNLVASVSLGYDFNTLLLLKFNEDAGSQTPYDDSIYHHEFVCNSTSQIVAGGKFGSNCVTAGTPCNYPPPGYPPVYPDNDFYATISAVDAYGIFCTVDPNPNLQFDFWFKPTSADPHSLFSNGYGNGLSVYIDGHAPSYSASITVWNNYYNRLKIHIPVVIGQWGHYRILIGKNVVRAGFNGVELGNCARTQDWMFWPIHRFDIGSSGYDTRGYFDDFVITAGNVSWLDGGGYTVPSASPASHPSDILVTLNGESTVSVTGSGEFYVSTEASFFNCETLEDVANQSEGVFGTNRGFGRNTVEPIVHGWRGAAHCAIDLQEGISDQQLDDVLSPESELDNLIITCSMTPFYGASSTIVSVESHLYFTPISRISGASLLDHLLSSGEIALDCFALISSHTVSVLSEGTFIIFYSFRADSSVVIDDVLSEGDIDVGSTKFYGEGTVSIDSFGTIKTVELVSEFLSESMLDAVTSFSILGNAAYLYGSCSVSVTSEGFITTGIEFRCVVTVSDVLCSGQIYREIGFVGDSIQWVSSSGEINVYATFEGNNEVFINAFNAPESVYESFVVVRRNQGIVIPRKQCKYLSVRKI